MRIQEIRFRSILGDNWREKIQEVNRASMGLAKLCFDPSDEINEKYPPVCDRSLMTDKDDLLCDQIKETTTLAVLSLEHMYAVARWTYVVNWGSSADAKAKAQACLARLAPPTAGRPRKASNIDPATLRKSYERLKERFGELRKALRDTRRAAKWQIEFSDCKKLCDEGLFTFAQLDPIGNVRLPVSELAILTLCNDLQCTRSTLFAKLRHKPA